MSKVVVTVFVSLLLSLGMQSAAFAVLAAVEQAEQVENSFRQAYPFHLQIIGLTPPLRDQSRVLIISEPPPHVSPGYFQSLVDSLGGKVFVKTHRIGYDGWTRDAVLALPPLSKDELSDLLTKLHLKIYSTTYKANAVQLPIKPPPASNRSLDLSVSVGDLNNWLNKKDLKFTPTIGGASRSLPEILSSRQSGVFISSERRGLVIWSIPRGQDLAKYRAEARQFFLDSDLIVGAIANNSQLAIVARERVEPILRLPPLRVETALMLAAEKSDELAQSYERDHLFAGKLRSGEDWAPIYLSDSLINTEFGSLLNITDQLLKSWSQNGNVKYFNFNYPQPSYWAPYPRPMSEIPGSILFNWNTAGAGYTTSIKSYEFFALNRTGVLPITYGFESNSVQDYERIAYKYFADLGNPDFAQVVQYTALYQIFRKFGIITKESTTQESLLSGTIFLALEASTLLKNLQVQSGKGLVEKLREAAEQNGLESQKAIGFTKLIRLLESINEGTTRWPNDAIPELSLLIASPRTYIPSIRGDRNFWDWVFSTYKQIQDPDTNILLKVFFDAELTKNGYVQALSEDPNTWIKTPSIVLSQDVTNIYYGGHNLDSTLTRLQSSPNVPIGRVRIVKDGTASVILYNPNDVGKVHSLSRLLATEAENPNLINNLENVLKETSGNQRSLPKALDIPNEQSNLTKPRDRGLTGIHEPPTSSPPLGWRLRDNPLTPDEVQQLVTADTLATRSIIIERSPDGYAILRSGNNQAVEAPTIVSFYDEVLPQFMNSMPEDGSPIQIYLNGFTSDEARALKLTGGLRQEVQRVAFRRSDRSFGENIALLKRSSYNWDRANIKEIKVAKRSSSASNLNDGQIIDDDIISIDIEVMSTIPNQSSLRLQIITSIKNLSKEIVARINAIVQKVLARPSSQSRNVNQVIFDIRQELRKEFPDIDIDVQVEAGDIYFTEPARGNRHVRRMSYDN
ncbi:MAG: hypothetical protein RMY36_012770 [Nostoc sp. SerVER01]|nr:hypothetical protein [Nostoc sp. SerVER01]